MSQQQEQEEATLAQKVQVLYDEVVKLRNTTENFRGRLVSSNIDVRSKFNLTDQDITNALKSELRPKVLAVRFALNDYVATARAIDPTISSQ